MTSFRYSDFLKLALSSLPNAKTKFSTHFYIPRRNNQNQPQTTATIFNKKVKICHLDRAASLQDAHIYEYIKQGAARDICDRIEDLKCDKKRVAFNFGSSLVCQHLNPTKIETLFHGEISEISIERAKTINQNLKFPIQYIHCDEEHLRLESNSADIVISSMNLHWVNDLVSCFKHVHRILRDDSAFVGAILGGDTLYELRSTLQIAELERLSGFSSHVSPKTTGQDIARLLQSTGFSAITVDLTDVKINYPSIFELMFDLQAMGESNATIHGSRHMNREVLQASAAIYQYLYGNDSQDISKGVPATFQVINFIGWKNPKKATPLKESDIDQFSNAN